jgi:DNA-binding response OmpR family regulator
MPRILLLDDEPLISMMMEDWLTELGCETVGPANSVPIALGLIDGASIDGAILDVSLGNEESYSVADALRERGVPFAFATGRGADGVAVRFQDALIVRKPFAFEEVRAVIAKLLRAS